MKKIVYLIVLFLSQIINAQSNEFGLFLGGSNFTGDVGPTVLIGPKQPAYGLIYKWNINTKYTLKFSAIQSKMKASDFNSSIEPRKIRDYNFENTINEISAQFEFNLFKFDLKNEKYASTPYISSGLNYFWSDNLYVENKAYKADGRSGSISIPMTAGYKIKVLENLVAGAEVGVRYTFIDDIDGSNPKNDKYRSFEFSNTKSNDWYVFTGITLTYIFSKEEEPCYCE